MTIIDVTVALEGHLDVSEDSDFRIALEESNGIRYWASDLLVNLYGITVLDNENYNNVERANWTKIASVVGVLASGYFIDYDGQKKRLGSDYIIRAAHDFLFDIENVDYDTDVMDMIIQMSVLGMVKYG